MGNNKKKNIQTTKQGSLWDEKREPATEIMKTVAARTLDMKRMKKDLTADEIKEILSRRDAGEAGFYKLFDFSALYYVYKFGKYRGVCGAI